MLHCRHQDILLELMELTHHRIDAVRCQLVYYRASVYKDETAQVIHAKVAELRVLVQLFGNDAIIEAFTDYDAMATQGDAEQQPWECSLTSRLGFLLGALDLHLSLLYKAATSRMLNTDLEALAETVRGQRAALLALCTPNSRQWTFFQSV
ncbi:MAG: hypothetical protein NTZ90_13725 [Proteobacteria bacterium]|nr:hypothetical protein [Pseudomonadota bacterium]